MKYVQNIVIVFFCFWLLSGFLGIVYGIDKEKFANTEMRNPSEINAITSYKSITEFFDAIEIFLTDRVAFRHIYISSYQFLGLNHVSTPFNSANTHIAGQDKWFFLGNAYNSVLDYTKNKEKIDNGKIKLKIKQLSELQHIARQSNIPYVMLIAPNKHTIYEEFLPKWIKIKSSYRFADAILEQATKNNLYLSFPKKELLNEKKHAAKLGKRLYWQDDTHWNGYGALIAFKSIWSILQKQGDFVNLSKSITLQTIKKTSNGDLIRIGKYPATYRDEISYSYNLNNDFKEAYHKQGHLLVIGDSFTSALMPLYEMVFEKIIRIHWNEVNIDKYKNLIIEHRPDAIIYQVVERHFPNKGIDMSHLN